MRDGKVFLAVGLVLVLGAGCVWMGPCVVDSYRQAMYRPAPDDQTKRRRVGRPEEGIIVARGMVIG